MKLPPELAQAIQSEVEKYSSKELARAAEELSRGYRSQVVYAAARLDSPIHQAAYLLTRLPATFAASWAVLSELKQRVPDASPMTMLDLGAGPGTAAWAAARMFPSLEKMTLVERKPEIIAVGKRLAAQADCEALRRAEWLGADLAAFNPTQRYDIVLLGYSLGELREPSRAALLERLWRKTLLALVVIEPGTPRGYNVVLRARDQLIAEKARLLAPCPHQGKCPMAGTRDWCHFAQRVERTSAHRRLKSGSLGYEDEKFSYMIFSREPSARAEARIVRHPIHGKGHIKLELCAQRGLEQITVTRSQGEAFPRARKAQWGDEWRDNEMKSPREHAHARPTITAVE